MVGTAMDYARFVQMLLNGGALDGKRILGPKTVTYIVADHLGHFYAAMMKPARWGLPSGLTRRV